ncbi:MAG TPA: hypothetical protein ENI33_01995 [Thermoplasmatales archaeon]|nr:hypothetical protein [Thermoplasmatales archaeon]
MKKLIVIIYVGLFLMSLLFSGSNNINAIRKVYLSDPPYIPSNPQPANGSTNVDVNTDLEWDGGDPDTCENVYYDIYFGVSPNPPFLEKIGPYPADQIRIVYSLDKLNYNTQYYWRIDAWDSYGYSTTGPTWTFTTCDDHPPYIPSNPNPPDGAVNVDINIDLSWSGGDPDGDPVVYDVYFGTNPNPPNVATGISSTVYDPGVLNYNTQYYWRIDAWDSYGYSTTGPTWTFRTEIPTNNPPNKPDRPFGPVSGMVGVVYSYSSLTTDPEGDGIYYMFDWGDGTTSSWIGPYESGQMVTSAHAWSMQGLYPIKIKAKDEHGLESVWSDPLSVSMPKAYPVIIEILERISRFLLLFGREIIPV